MTFDEDTRVLGDATTISGRWNNLAGHANGGYVLALCTKALAAALPQPDPLVVSGFFLRPGAEGAATLHVETMRAGRRVATGEARLVQAETEIARVVASFGDLARAEGRSLVLGERPRLPPPEECRDLFEGQGMRDVSISRQIDYRVPELPGWRLGRPSGRPYAELWMRFADGREPDVMALPLFVDAAPPAVAALGASGSTTLELTVHVRGRPVPGWLACRVSTRHLIDGYHEEDVELWDASGALVAQSRQFALMT